MLAVSATAARTEEKWSMKELTCAKLTKLGFKDFAGVTMWLSGHYNGASATPSSTLRITRRPRRQ
jgi:hypothetical protein